jgi:hypothetical protein
MQESIEDPRPASSAPLIDSNRDSTDPDPEFQFSLPLTITIDETGGQLSAPKTNTKAELSIPRAIISESGSKSSLIQAELLRPILAGTHLGDPSYLVRLQLHLYTPGASRSWLSRIQNASINVLLEDAPHDQELDSSDEDQDDDEDKEPMHPSIVNTFPGGNGWKGPLRSALVTETIDFGTQLGYGPFISVSGNRSNSETRVKTGSVKVKLGIKGRRSNILHVVVEENPIDREGVPDFLVIPFVIAHKARRFSMRVAVNARYGFVRGKLAEMWPILGRADEPLYFDPLVMRQVMEKGQRDDSGKKKVEWRGVLDSIELQDYSSLN